MKLLRANQCCVCGRMMTKDESIARGTGDICATARATMLDGIGTTEAELATIAECGEDVSRFVQFILTDLYHSNARSAKHWLSSARRKMGNAILQTETI